MQKIVDVATIFINKAKKVVKTVEIAKQKLSALMAPVIKAAKYIRDNVIRIHHVCMKASLKEASSACMDLNIAVTLGGKKRKDLTVPACLDVSFMKNLAKDIAYKLFPGISKVKETLAKISGMFKRVNEEKIEADKAEKDLSDSEQDLDETSINNSDVDDEMDDEDEEIEAQKREVW